MKITEFIYPGYPYCIRMGEIMTELKAENPELSQIELEIIDETIHPEIAGKYDYFYCPSFYLGERKIFEQQRMMDRGSSKESIRAVLLSLL